MSDILKKPVHPKVLEKPHIRKLQDDGKLPDGVVVQSLPKEAKLPRPQPPPKKSRTGLVKFEPLKGLAVSGKNINKTATMRAKLRVLHERIKSPEDAPCDTCKTAACCSAFVVSLTKLEYESGLYEPNAVKITSEMKDQLRGQLIRPGIVGGPSLVDDGDAYYYLEGRVGQPCSFLGIDNRCTIYEVRPGICRAYSCVEDPRITQEVRDGTEPIMFSTEYAEKYA